MRLYKFAFDAWKWTTIYREEMRELRFEFSSPWNCIGKELLKKEVIYSTRLDSTLILDTLFKIIDQNAKESRSNETRFI